MNIIRYEIIIPVLVFFSVIAIGASIFIARLQKRKIVEERLSDELSKEQSREPARERSPFLQFIEKVGNFASHGQATTTLWEQLIRAGYLNPAAPAIYTGIKLLLFVIGLGTTAIVLVPLEISLPAKMTSIFLGGAVLFFIPNFIISMKLKKNHDEICQHLPEAIDLLEICVSSGIGLDMAWNIVADEIQHVSTVLANAMALSNFEIHLGARRVEAMRHMSERTGVEDLSSLAAILIQTERFGTSIATTLKVFAVSMREERSFTAEENAEKMAVKLIIPMVLFIFPAILVVVAGPAVITIYRLMISGS